MKLPPYNPESARATRFLFFTGKGGVGKTCLACATALRFSEEGRRVLLVSTDPASNLDEVLQTALANKPTAVAGVPRLLAMNIDPVAAAARYRERLVGPMRGVLPAAALENMTEQLSGACTTEIAAFDEFSGLIGDPAAAADFDHVIFDTAPTGHTLRLMGLAKAWDEFLSNNTSGSSCLGPLAGLLKQRGIYEATVRALGDAAATTLVLVTRPQRGALREAERTGAELRLIGVGNQILVVNGIFEAASASDPVSQAMQNREEAALSEAGEFLRSMPCFGVPLRGINILGIAGLRLLLVGDDATPAFEQQRNGEHLWHAPKLESLSDLVAVIEGQGSGVVMTMGKGGVGKTTVAAAIAVLLAKRGHRVHLSTTDPAAHIAQTLNGAVEGLSISQINPLMETEAYRREVMDSQRRDLDEAGIALLQEDLRSPCTEEIAVFRAFAREVARGARGFVVLDTAPTGHTLLLLDASAAFQRQLQRQAGAAQSDEVLLLSERLRDPDFTRMLMITLPEATPVHEAAALQADLRRAGIEPFAWVINQSLLFSGSRDPLLVQRAAAERRYVAEVVERHARRTAWVPWMAGEPVGPDALLNLAELNAPGDDRRAI
jgi:arsenite-transporting ATPase